MTATMAALPAATDVAQHTSAVQWLWVIVPVGALIWALAWLWRNGTATSSEALGALATPLARIADSLRRLTGLPAWCAGGLALSTWSLLVAVVGFFWDVAWHIDLGRDTELFTVPHTLILLGLLGLGAAALFSIALATVERAPTAWHLRSLRIPRGALALGVLSAGAALGFPLDDLWHANYGVDVTMWGPTHLLMIGGASLAPIAQWLLATEAGLQAGKPWVRREIRTTLVQSTIVGLSTFQLEFDYGIPQWQALYQPVLIMLATSIGIVAVRVAFGRGWGIGAALEFLAMRGILALLVGPGLGHVVPRFPLYLGIGAVVEVAAWTVRRRGVVAGALLTGLSVGTVGLATEWGFSHLWGRHPWHADLLPAMWAAVLIAVAGAVIGTAMGRIGSQRRAAIPMPVLAAAFVAVAAALIVPFPRSTTPMSAVLHATPAGPATPAVTRDGIASPYQEMNLRLTLSPPDAAHGADWFEAMSWQGGVARNTAMVEVAPGEYRSAASVPTGSTWKTLVWFAKGDLMMATPVSMPLDPQYGQGPITPNATQNAEFVASSSLLLRESHGGAAWPAIVAYTGLLGITMLWLALLVAAFASIDRGPRDSNPTPDRTLRGHRAATRPQVSVG
jgi:hypothetical protein